MTADPYAGCRAIAERRKFWDDRHDAQMRQVSDNGRKLISPRDLYDEMFARIDAEVTASRARNLNTMQSKDAAA